MQTGPYMLGTKPIVLPQRKHPAGVKAAVSTCVSSGCQSFRLGISRNPVSETMQGMYQILDGK